MKTSAISFWFYFGTLLSSIGSFTYNICLVAFMSKTGFDLFHISLILGLQRLVPTSILGVYGHLTDRLPPRSTIVLSEIMAALATGGIFLTWSKGAEAYVFFLGFTILKSSMVQFQTGSKATVSKILSDSSYISNSRNAIWFNKATQGATLFAGLCALPIIKYLSFETAIIFDLVTFLVNGLIVFTLPIARNQQVTTASKEPFWNKFKDLYIYNKKAATLDALLAISMMGTTSFTARLVGNDQKWMAMLIGIYGVAVWLAGYIEKSGFLKAKSAFLWVGLSSSYLILGMNPGQGWLTVLLALSKDTFYWLLLHRISSHIQTDTPENKMGAVSSARTTQMIFILALGELAVGSWSSFVPVAIDGLWRAVFSLVILGSTVILRSPSKPKDGYAHL